MDYKDRWTEFEVQSLAFSILRKNLYPRYLVRGEYKFLAARTDIAIFKANPVGQAPTLLCVIEIKKSDNGKSTKQGERYTQELGVPCVYVRGVSEAYNILSLVQPHL